MSGRGTPVRRNLFCRSGSAQRIASIQAFKHSSVEAKEKIDPRLPEAAINLFGHQTLAIGWLSKPTGGLGDKRPIDGEVEIAMEMIITGSVPESPLGIDGDAVLGLMLGENSLSDHMNLELLQNVDCDSPRQVVGESRFIRIGGLVPAVRGAKMSPQNTGSLRDRLHAAHQGSNVT